MAWLTLMAAVLACAGQGLVCVPDAMRAPLISNTAAHVGSWGRCVAVFEIGYRYLRWHP